MKSLDYLKLVEERGYATEIDCSTVIWTKKVANMNPEDFLAVLREKSNLSNSEMIFLVNKLSDVLPADIIESWIRKVAADPGAASVLAIYALRWKEGDVRRKIFFEEFVKTFAENPHYQLSNIIFPSGVSE